MAALEPPYVISVNVLSDRAGTDCRGTPEALNDHAGIGWQNTPKAMDAAITNLGAVFIFHLLE
jgi:hypothetical protein